MQALWKSSVIKRYTNLRYDCTIAICERARHTCNVYISARQVGAA